jgi:hypothetical protein
MSPERELSSAEDADAVDSHGTRIVRSTTTFAPRNHHSSTTEKKTMMHTEAGAIEVRRAEPVDPQPKPITLLHRFFGGQ